MVPRSVAHGRFTQLWLRRHHCGRGAHHFTLRTGTVDGSAAKARAGDEYTLPLGAWDFTTLISVRAKRKVHSGELEACCVCLGIRRLARGRSFQGRRILILVDALASLGAFQRGRSSALTLRGSVRQAWAVLLTADVRPRFGYIPSEFNPADPPSRGTRLEKCRWRGVRHGFDSPFLRRVQRMVVGYERLMHDNRSRSQRAEAASAP